MNYNNGQRAQMGDRINNRWGDLGTVVEVSPFEIVIKWTIGLPRRYRSADVFSLAARARNNSEHGGMDLKRAASTSTLRVLVVDDFEMWRSVVASIVQRFPNRVIVSEASDGLEAVQKASESQPNLVILDIGLPTANGIDAAKMIRVADPQSRILFLSQHRSPDVIQEALDAGAMGYVYKPRAQTELLPAIESVLAGRQFVSGELEYHGPSWGRDLHLRPLHKVHFYFDESAHVRNVTDFLGSSLESGSAAVVVATRECRASLYDALKKRGVDVDAAERQGTYIALDADDTLSGIMVDEQIDGPRFFDAFGKLIGSASKAAKRPRVALYGEAVALLMARRNVDAAIGLEQLANELIKKYNVEILCAYPAASMDSKHSFTEICAEHSGVTLI